jgi:hypothetical protein
LPCPSNWCATVCVLQCVQSCCIIWCASSVVQRLGLC